MQNSALVFSGDNVVYDEYSGRTTVNRRTLPFSWAIETIDVRLFTLRLLTAVRNFKPTIDR